MELEKQNPSGVIQVQSRNTHLLGLSTNLRSIQELLELKISKTSQPYEEGSWAYKNKSNLQIVLGPRFYKKFAKN